MENPGFPIPLREGQTLPRAGVWGNPGYPTPLCTGCALTFPRAGGWGNPGYPTPLRTGCALTFPRAGGWGNPVSPWSRETVMRIAHHAAMHMPWERGRPARIAAPRAR